VKIHFAVILWPWEEGQNERFSAAVLVLFHAPQLFNDVKSV